MIPQMRRVWRAGRVWRGAFDGMEPSSRATARTDVIDWRTVPSANETMPSDAWHLRLIVSRTFRGDIAGESVGELWLWVADPEDPDRQYTYFACDRVTARIGDRGGTFTLEYWGTNASDGRPRSGGHVTPGSGTGALAGLEGTVEVFGDATGPHTITLIHRFSELLP
jgi:hypothetical protein